MSGGVWPFPGDSGFFSSPLPRRAGPATGGERGVPRVHPPIPPLDKGGTKGGLFPLSKGGSGVMAREWERGGLLAASRDFIGIEGY